MPAASSASSHMTTSTQDEMSPRTHALHVQRRDIASFIAEADAQEADWSPEPSPKVRVQISRASSVPPPDDLAVRTLALGSSRKTRVVRRALAVALVAVWLLIALGLGLWFGGVFKS